MLYKCVKTVPFCNGNTSYIFPFVGENIKIMRLKTYFFTFFFYSFSASCISPAKVKLHIERHKHDLFFEVFINVFEVFTNVFEVFINVFEVFTNVFEVFINVFEVFTNVFEVFINVFEVFTNVFEVFINVFEVFKVYLVAAC